MQYIGRKKNAYSAGKGRGLRPPTTPLQTCGVFRTSRTPWGAFLNRLKKKKLFRSARSYWEANHFDLVLYVFFFWSSDRWVKKKDYQSSSPLLPYFSCMSCVNQLHSAVFDLVSTLLELPALPGTGTFY